MMTFQDIPIAQDLGRELIDIPLITDGNANESGNIFTDLLAIDEGLITFDHAARFKLLHSLHNGGSGQLHLVGDIGETSSTVILQNRKNF